MSKVNGKCRRARQQLRDLYLAGNEEGVFALLQQVVGASKARNCKSRTFLWAPAQQFARVYVQTSIAVPANEDAYE